MAQISHRLNVRQMNWDVEMVFIWLRLTLFLFFHRSLKHPKERFYHSLLDTFAMCQHNPLVNMKRHHLIKCMSNWSHRSCLLHAFLWLRAILGLPKNNWSHVDWKKKHLDNSKSCLFGKFENIVYLGKIKAFSIRDSCITYCMLLWTALKKSLIFLK